MSELQIRPGEERDLETLTAIYNHYVVHSPATFDLEPYTVEQRRAWFDSYAATGRHRLLVAELGDALIGYTTSSQFRTKRAYDTSVETTIYLRPEHMGKGYGALLYDALFRALATESVHRCVAGITLPNAASVALHTRYGFEPVGVFREIGYKHGRYWDVGWFQKEFAGSAAP